MDRASARATMPAETARILDARSLATSHRRLAEIVRSGMVVLDVGCGTGAITRGIAEIVGGDGCAVGVDVNQTLLARGGQQGLELSSLKFVRADVYALPFRRAFDIVTAARVLQWLAQPKEGIRALAEVCRSGGTVLALDYDHEQLEWHPSPPCSVQQFYAAFLRWRADAGMDNAIGTHLPELFKSAGLAGVLVTPQYECTNRGDVDFADRITLWQDVAATRGRQMVADGVLSEPERARAESEYGTWAASAAESMTLHLVAIEGSVAR